MLAVALASSVVRGTADFLAGISTRRLTLAPALVVSQLAGLVLLGVATGLTGELGAHAVTVGLAAGAFGALGIAAFYRALVTGTISIVSPVSACPRSSVRMPPGRVPAAAAIGLLDVGANALFAAAATRGYLSIVSVLGSEYPVVTVILAQKLLGERVSRPQAAGIALALIGVGIVSVN